MHIELQETDEGVFIRTAAEPREVRRVLRKALRQINEELPADAAAVAKAIREDNVRRFAVTTVFSESK